METKRPSINQFTKKRKNYFSEQEDPKKPGRPKKKQPVVSKSISLTKNEEQILCKIQAELLSKGVTSNHSKIVRIALNLLSKTSKSDILELHNGLQE
jgi:hypothetical protein